MTKDQCACGHNRVHHRMINGREICNISPCGCMDFEALTSKRNSYERPSPRRSVQALPA